jgi:hypothetical protein
VPVELPIATRFPLAFLLVLVAAGCASSRGGSASTPVERAATTTPWIVPSAELDSQRLLRARLVSEEGRGRFRLLVRLQNPERYQIRATHPLFNQRLWTLDVSGEQAVLVDYQQHMVCRYEGAAEIAAIPLGPFPFASLPALLLGYLPLPPAGAPERPSPRALAFEDAEGRRWTAELDHDVVDSFAVEGEERVTWRRDEEGWYVLAADARGLDLRWRETLREPLTDTLQSIEAPADYAAGPCDLGWLKGVEDTPLDE